jgi:hypothetical protein
VEVKRTKQHARTELRKRHPLPYRKATQQSPEYQNYLGRLQKTQQTRRSGGDPALSFYTDWGVERTGPAGVHRLQGADKQQQCDAGVNSGGAQS